MTCDTVEYDQCSYCDVRDGTVTRCDDCGRFICLEHDYQPGHYDEAEFDTDAVLCEDCNEAFHLASERCEHSAMNFTLDDKAHSVCRSCSLNLMKES